MIKFPDLLGPFKENYFLNKIVSHDIQMMEARQHQEKILSSLVVHKVENLPGEISKCYQDLQMIGRTSSSVIKSEIPNGLTVEAGTTWNGVQMMCVLERPSNLWIDESSRIVRNYYYIDNQNQKYFDLSDVWKLAYEEKEIKTIAVTTSHNQKSAAFPSSEDGVYMTLMNLASYLNEPSDSHVYNYLDPVHETAHMLQKSLSSEPFNRVMARVFMDNYVTLLTSDLGLKIGRSNMVQNLKMGREDERNAHAFSLSLVRSLQKKSVDLLPNISNLDLLKFLDMQLKTFDRKKLIRSGLSPTYSKWG